MNKLRYWKNISLNMFAVYSLFPSQELLDTHPAYEKTLKYIKENGFGYTITKITTSEIESNVGEAY